MMLKRCLAGVIFALAVLCPALGNAAGSEAQPPLVFAGPPEGILSLPVLRMLETSTGRNIKFEPWNTPDQLRAIVAGGKADIVACHTHVAANLANRGADVRLLNVTLWKLMWIVTSDNTLTTNTTIAAIAEKNIGVPMRGDLTEVVLSAIAKKSAVQWNPVAMKSSHDAAQWLLTGRLSSAVLPEPIVSHTLLRSETGEQRTVTLWRGLDVQQLWSEAFGTPARLPLAGIAAVGHRHAPQRYANFTRDYAQAAQWCRENPEEAAKLPARQTKANMLAVTGIARSLTFAPPEPEPAARVRSELEAYLEILRQHDPALIGGKLPNDAFYSSE